MKEGVHLGGTIGKRNDTRWYRCVYKKQARLNVVYHGIELIVFKHITLVSNWLINLNGRFNLQGLDEGLPFTRILNTPQAKTHFPQTTKFCNGK